MYVHSKRESPSWALTVGKSVNGFYFAQPKPYLVNLAMSLLILFKTLLKTLSAALIQLIYRLKLAISRYLHFHTESTRLCNRFDPEDWAHSTSTAGLNDLWT